MQVFDPSGANPRVTSIINGFPRFAGHTSLLDHLFDVRARIYDSENGRFLQPDPSEFFDVTNPYTYAQHNPVDFIDPNGENPLFIGALIGLAMGAIFGGLNVRLRRPEGLLR